MDDQHKRAFENYHVGFSKVIERFRFFEERRKREEEKSNPEPYLIDMDEEAKQLDIDDYNQTIAPFGPGEEHPFETRRNEIAIRVALVLYVFSCIRFERDSDGKLEAIVFAHEEGRFLTGEWMKKSLELMDWYDRQQKEFRLIGESREEDRQRQMITAMIMERGGREVKERELYHGRKVFRDKKETQKAMNKFVAARQFLRCRRKGAGQAGFVYTLPPQSDRF
jgi:hypothetical protein